MKKIFTFLIITFLFGQTMRLIAQITPHEAIPQMQKGINLGNTLEPPLEGGWNNPPAQEYYFDLYKQAGFSTIRIPVRWDEHTQDTGDFMVDAPWMQRVEQVVDWALNRDLFVVLNAHHEEWIKSGYANPLNRARFDSIWSQIAIRFKDKPEKLLFEIINEPYGLTKAQNDDLHARILSIIRKTNPTRIVIIQGHNWGGSDELIAANIPEDPYLIGSFHSYDPYNFGLQGIGTWGTTTDYNALKAKFQTVKNWSDTTNVPVILGEFGSLRTCDYNSRMKHYRAYVEYAQQFGFVSCAWDDGGDFKIMERAARKWDEVKDILIHSNNKAPRNLNMAVVNDTVVRISWVNAVSDADSIIIQHRLPNGYYVRIASLQGDTSLFNHLHAAQNTYNHYRIIARYNTGIEMYSQPMRIFMPVYVPKFRGFFTGQRLAIPGTIEAEHYDTGGEGLTYHDATERNITGAFRPEEAVDIYTGNNVDFIVGNIWPGEWIEYSVDVLEQGPYKVDFHIAAYQPGGTFRIKIGEKESPILVAPSSNSLVNTKVLTDTMELDAGEQIMRFTIISDNPSYNIDKIIFTSLVAPTSIVETETNLIGVEWKPGSGIIISWHEEIFIKRIELYDVNGGLLRYINYPANNSAISTEGLTPGLYITRVVTDSNSYPFKIIIK